MTITDLAPTVHWQRQRQLLGLPQAGFRYGITPFSIVPSANAGTVLERKHVLHHFEISETLSTWGRPPLRI